METWGLAPPIPLFCSPTQLGDYFMERHTWRKTLNFKPVFWFSRILNKTRSWMKVMAQSAFSGSHATASWCTLLRDWRVRLIVKSHWMFSTMTFKWSVFPLFLISVSPYYHPALHQYILRIENKLSWLKKEKQTCCKENNRINLQCRPVWMGLLTGSYTLSSFWEFPLPVHQK